MAAHVLHRDFETRSPTRLDLAGAWRYAADRETEILCVGFAVDDQPADIWTPGQPVPDVFFEAARDPAWSVVAHNDQFETAIERHVLQPRYGWPLVPIERHCCTMAMALAAALPGSLEGAAEALGLSLEKDAAGYRVMRRLSVPRRPRKGEDPTGIYWHDDDFELSARLLDYCKQDVEIERLLFNVLPPLSESEQQVWARDAQINARGFQIDLDLARAAQKIVEQEQAAVDAAIAKLTNGAITSANQTARISAYLKERGQAITGLSKEAVRLALAANPDGDIGKLLELRRDGAQAAARKINRLIACAGTDGRLRGSLRLHGASTGRWSGRAFQPQNLKKS